MWNLIVYILRVGGEELWLGRKNLGWVGRVLRLWIKSREEDSVTHAKTEGPLGTEVFVYVTEAEAMDLIHFIAHIS